VAVPLFPTLCKYCLLYFFSVIIILAFLFYICRLSCVCRNYCGGNSECYVDNVVVLDEFNSSVILSLEVDGSKIGLIQNYKRKRKEKRGEITYEGLEQDPVMSHLDH